ncbi:hypothetical protein B0H16DRAFT_1736513 [Mycena metata]|uniref:Uncharacterized protein n=1 Tax=Mycena metata TaxID=1033252 RepID=A0AAD7HNN9_9AGAR|nr:hypothetical protein B0H16DRAFT_1736513 [Mycena metata]
MKWWISQQAYVLKHLQRASGAKEDFLPLDLVTGITFEGTLDTKFVGFTLWGTSMTDAPTDQVYLFLFPPKVNFVAGQFTATNLEDSKKYYWSLDPAGLDRLTHEVAEDFGLPTLQFSVEVYWRRWDRSDPDIIREFHAAKGFDPDSQDVAIAMGYPLVDVKAIKNSVSKLTGQCSLTDSDTDEIEDGIYYSLGLC